MKFLRAIFAVGLLTVCHSQASYALASASCDTSFHALVTCTYPSPNFPNPLTEEQIHACDGLTLEQLQACIKLYEDAGARIREQCRTNPTISLWCILNPKQPRPTCTVSAFCWKECKDGQGYEVCVPLD